MYDLLTIAGRLLDEWLIIVGILLDEMLRKCWDTFENLLEDALGDLCITIGRLVDDCLKTATRLLGDFACHLRQAVGWSRIAEHNFLKHDITKEC